RVAAAVDQAGGGGRAGDGGDVVGILAGGMGPEAAAPLGGGARHVDDADALVLQMRRHAKHAADGDHAGAADAGDDDVIGVVDHRQLRLGQRRQARLYRLADRELRAMHGYERRAEAFDAGVVLVAAGLVDGALASELGLERLHRHAVRHDAAIAAALADELVDDHALVGIGEGAALPSPALLGRAG